jgi:hypothetical protein
MYGPFIFELQPGENLRERDHMEDLDVDERIILKWILKQ